MKELNRFELAEINGGSALVKWFKGTIWFMVGSYLIDHWPDLKAGVVDGWTDGQIANK